LLSLSFIGVPLVATTGADARTAIVVGGTSAPDARYIVDRLAGFDRVIVVSYPATVIFPSYDVSVAEGKANLRSALSGVSDDQVVVYGFSQGARIAGDVLAEPETVGVTGVLYSDPRQASAGVETQLPFNLPGAAMTGERDPFVVPVETHCIPRDGVCDWNNHDPLGSIIGYLKHHTTYF